MHHTNGSANTHQSNSRDKTRKLQPTHLTYGCCCFSASLRYSRSLFTICWNSSCHSHTPHTHAQKKYGKRREQPPLNRENNRAKAATWEITPACNSKLAARPTVLWYAGAAHLTGPHVQARTSGGT